MNMLKTGLLAALIALSASAAQAFTPPYHINSPATGKATIQSSGSCKIKQTYEGAQWGVVFDSTDAQVGYGIISASGELLAVLSDYETISSAYDTATGKGNDVYFEDLDSSETIATIESLAGCTVRELISSAKTKGTYTYDPSKNKNDFSLVYPFNGISPTLDTVKGTKSTYKAQTFSGKITFKGSYPDYS
jgi:hypothetical protein